MNVYIECNIDSKELFDMLVRDNIPCFIMKVSTKSWYLITLENIKKYKYKFKYKNKNRRSCFIYYKLYKHDDFCCEITSKAWIGNELYITWKSIIGTGCFIVETYKVSEEIIEKELIKIWYTLH